MKRIGNRTCPECGSVDVRRRGSGVNARAEKPIWCQSCNHRFEWKDLGKPKSKEEREESGNLQHGLAKQLSEMDPDSI